MGLALVLAGLVLTSGCGPLPLIVIGVAAGTGALGGGHSHHGGSDTGAVPPPPSPPPPPPSPPSPQPPTAPSGLSATASGATRVDLQWTDGSTDHTGFKVERRVRGTQAFGQIATTDRSVLSYTDSSLSPGTDYEYQVVATGPTGDSAPSNTAAATTWMTIASISPGGGPIAGGTAVSISGAGFRPGATVSIGGTPLVNVVVQSATTIAGVTTSSIAVGAGDVVVSGPNGQSVLAGAFDYRLGLTQAGAAVSLGGYSASDLVVGDFNGDGRSTWPTRLARAS